MKAHVRPHNGTPTLFLDGAPSYAAFHMTNVPSDPDRLVPLVWTPEDFMITVSGDPGRDNCFLCAQNGFIGYPVTKKINLPANWKSLLAEAVRK